MNNEESVSKKTPWYKRRLIYLAACVVLVIGGIAYGKSRSSPAAKYETVKVVRVDLRQTVDATGNIESADEIDLKFDTSGRISRIYKQVGDYVKIGDTIAELDLRMLNAAVAQASASVAKAEANLAKELAGNTPAHIQSLEASLKKAQADLDHAVASSANSIHSAESALETAKNNLKLAEGGEDSQIVQDAYDDMIALLKSIQNTLSSSLTEADNILGIDNQFANDTFESILASGDINKKLLAESNYLTAKVDVTAFNAKETDISSAHSSIDAAALLAEAALLSTKTLLFNLSGVLDKTYPTGALSVSGLDTLKVNIQTARTNVVAKYTSLLDQKQAIKAAKNSYTSYDIVYKKTQKDLEDAKQKAEADMASYEALVDKAQATLDDAKTPPREVDLASYKAALREAEANLSQAVANRDKARIVAPVSGTIGKVGGKVGGYVTSQDVIVKLVSPHFEIKVDIPETDIGKIQAGNHVSAKLDALGDDMVFEGLVVKIEKGETVIQDVVYYRVTIALDEDMASFVAYGDKILNGMTANVVFSTNDRQGVLAIPQRAIRTNGSGKYVRVLENGELRDVLVKVGLRGDGGMVEVIDGLTEGQEVVVSVVEKGK